MAEDHNTIPTASKWPPVGCYGNVLIYLVECHEETKIVFQRVRDGIEKFCTMMKERSGEIEILQTGSSYDGLSVSMYHGNEAGDGDGGSGMFIPETDFDFMVVFSKYLLNDTSSKSCAEVNCSSAGKGCMSVENMKYTSSHVRTIDEASLENAIADLDINQREFSVSGKDISTDTSVRTKTDVLKTEIPQVEYTVSDKNISMDASVRLKTIIPNTEAPQVKLKVSDKDISTDVSVRPKTVIQKTKAPPVKFTFDRNRSEYFAEMVPSEHVGYVYLVLTEKGKQQLKNQGAKFPQAYKILDQVTSNWLIPHTVFKGEEVLKEYSSAGPALSKYDRLDSSQYSYDFVLAFPCKAWPEAADEWLKRKRKWPPQDIVDKLKNGGCHVVPCGYYDDAMSEYQWRLSLNKAERVLSRLLTSAQRRCYILVKLLLKQTLPSESALSSYHVKNLLFWLCEEHPPEEWKDENLGQWVHHLLNYVAVSLASHNVANYFVVDNNMIRHKNPSEVKETLKHVQNLLDAPMLHLCKTLQYIGLYDEQKVAVKTQFTGEFHSSMVVYAVLMEYLKGRAMSAICTKIGIEAIRMITILNRSAPKGSKRTGAFYTAIELIDLLWPLASAFTSDGDLRKAVWLYEAILEEDKEGSLKRYPQILTNLACGYNVLSQQTEDSNQKMMHVDKAKCYFSEALTLGQPSMGLYFTYGSFLLENDLLHDAEQVLRLATTITPGQDHNTAFVQIQIPGMVENIKQNSNVPICIAARYFLVDCLLKKGSTDDCDTVVNDMEKLSSDIDLNDQPVCFYLTGVLYKRLGLNEKGCDLSERAKDLSELLQSVQGR